MVAEEENNLKKKQVENNFNWTCYVAFSSIHFLTEVIEAMSFEKVTNFRSEI